VLCPECNKFNPDSNRFCGNCGHAFSKEPVSHYPREGFDDISEAGPEIADINPRIPANEYSRPRETVLHSEPQVPAGHADEAVETETVHAERQREREEARPRNSTSIFDLEPRESEKPRFDTDPRAVKPVTYGTNMFEYDPVAAERANTGIHGPSFLGLGDPDFLDEIDEPKSHASRKWLILALLIVIGVAAVQWRNIRDTGMQYAGTMHLSLPSKKGEGPAKMTPEQASPTASGETSAAAEGKPEMVVGPTNNDAQKPSTATPSQNATDNTADANAKSDSDSSASNSGAAMQGSDDNKNANAKTSDSKSSDSKEVASAKKSDDSASSKDDSADDSDTEAAPPAKSARSARAANKRAAKSIDESVSTAGADDLARAEKATDPATAANWLWAATKKGNSEAPVRLADYYANGRGVPKDCEQATVLLRSSARRGNPRARARLGMYYATGQCVAQDRAQAWHWLSLAHQADPGSDWIEQYRQRLWSQMTPDERAHSNASSTASE
jgi:TPR repeat protein